MFVSLVSICLAIFFLEFTLCGTIPWTWVSFSFPMVGNFSAIFFSNIFSGWFSCPFGTPIMWILVHLKLSQIFLRLYSFLFFIMIHSSGLHHSLSAHLPVSLPYLLDSAIESVSGVCLSGSHVLSKTLSSLPADWWPCVPALLVVWPEAFPHWSPQAAGWGQVLVRKPSSLQESLHQGVLTSTTTTSSIVPTVSHSQPLPSQEVSLASSQEITAFCPGS